MEVTPRRVCESRTELQPFAPKMCWMTPEQQTELVGAVVDKTVETVTAENVVGGWKFLCTWAALHYRYDSSTRGVQFSRL